MSMLRLHVDTTWRDDEEEEEDYVDPHAYDSPSVFSHQETDPLTRWSHQTPSSSPPLDERSNKKKPTKEKRKGK